MPTASSPASHIYWSSIVETGTGSDYGLNARLEQESQDLSAIVDLLERVAAAVDFTTACHTAAGELQQYLNCDRVVLGSIGSRGSRCRLKAVSGVSDFDTAAPLTAALERAFDETLALGAPVVWPASNTADPSALSAHRQLTEISGAAAAFTIPLARDRNPAIGACTVLAGAGKAITDRDRKFLTTCAAPLAAVLATAIRTDERPWLRTAKKIVSERLKPRRNILALSAGIVAIAMFLPTPYHVVCECQLQPVVRRVIAAPFAGTLAHSLVKPGDVVRRGETLGHMDGREIRWELAGIVADQSRAAKNHDVSMAENKIASAQMDALEMDRLESKRRLLADRAAHLDIKSPIDGVVISGDLKRSEGTPVAVGQMLYEIAPLDRMVAEVAILDEEISRARPGQSISLALDAFTAQTWSGVIESIEPRSESHDNENVFIANVNLDNRDLTLRPGMKGRAKVEMDPRSLGWIVFHKTWSRMTEWLAW